MPDILKYLFVSLLLIIILAHNAFAQTEPDSVLQDTVSILEYQEKPFVTSENMDTIDIVEAEEEHSPRKATLYSAILPGLGQAYNKKYWKIPLIYGGAVGLGIAIDVYAGHYAEFRRHLLEHRATGSNSLNVSLRVIERATDKSRRERDFWIIMSGLAYLVVLADAHIDAHLRGFDVSDDLAFKIKPSFNSTAFATPVGGLSLTFYIK